MTYRRRISHALRRTARVLIVMLVTVATGISVGAASANLSGPWANVFSDCLIALVGGAVGFVSAGLFMFVWIYRALSRAAAGDA